MRKLKLFFACLLMAVFSIGQVWADDTGTITFGSASGSTNINAASVTGDDSQGNTWTITTAGTTSFTPNADYAQIGSSKKPATSVTFTTTLAAEQTISAFSASFGGFSGTAGTVTLKVGNTEVGTGSLNGTTDVTVNATNTTTAGTVLTVTVTDIAKGVKVTSISYTYTSGGGGGGDDPSLSVAPTSINFGTVYKDATVESQTVAVTFANLTGDVTYSGLTSPFTASGTVSATGDEITIAADASTIGEYEQTLTVTSADDDKSATVTVTMNVVAAPEPTGTFALFSGALTEGDYVIYYDGKAMKNTVSSNRLDYTAVTPSENKITNPDVSLIWHIAASGDYWTIYNAAVEKYAAGTGTKNQAGLLADGTDNKSLWTASGSETYEFVNKAHSASSINANLRNNGTYGFACYASGTGGALTLYKKQLPAHELTFGVASSGHGTLAASVGGSAINSGAQVAEGATVTLTPTADTYYQVSAVEVLDGNTDAVTTTENAGVYTFAMPASEAVAEVSFAYIPVTGLTLNKSALDLLVGAEETLSVTAVEPEGAFAGVNWTTSAAGVATVDADGKVTAKAEGTATITATSVVTGTVTATCAVTVNAPSGHAIGITSANGTVTANTGVDVADVLKDVDVVLTATPNDGYTISGWTVVGLEEGDYSISQDKTTCSFTMPDDEVLIEVAYTHEVAVLKLHDANGESTFAGDHFWKEEVTLPTSAAACSKTFVGWSADANCATAPELGETYVLPNKGTNDIYAVYATANGGNNDVVFNAGTYASANSWANGTAYTDFTIDGVNFKANGGGNNGKYYTSDNSWRMYNGGSIAITASANIVSVTSTPSQTFTINGTSASVSFSETVKITAITVTVEGETTYSGYTTTCQQQAAAPTFSVEAGTYYVAQNNIVLSSTTENATIYYTTDGSDPKTSGTKQTYSAAISLSERAITTIKAYAVAEGYENSEVAEAQYNINLPYSVAEFNELTLENNKEYAVRGIISQIDDVQSGKLTYYISANGATEGQLKLYKGLGLEKATFSAVTDVNLGDNVTVVGTWSTQHSNLNQDNWMLEYTARIHDSYEIVGGLTSTTFQVGEAFDDAILGNLSVKEVFTNGYEEAVAGATFNCGDKTEWLENETSLTVYAKLGDDDLTSKNFDVTVSSATLVSFALKEGYKTEYYVGDEFVKPTVIATLTDNTHPEAEATACTGYNMSAAGNYTVNVAFTYGDITIDEGVTYQITVKAVFDNEDAPHTVAKAIELIEASAYQAKQSSTDYMWVSGKVSGFNGTSNKNYYISDDGTATGQLYVYSGSYFGGAAFTDANKLHVGDEVILKATILNYNGNTAELTNSQVVSQFRAPEFAFADIVADDEFEVNISEDLTVVPTANSGEAEFTLTSGNPDAVTIVEGKLHAVAEGDAVITATRAATANENALNYKEATITFNVHVIAERTRYTVSFDADGGTGTDPVIANQLPGAPVELPENPYSKESSAFAGWVVNDGEVEITDGQFTMPEGNVTIKATWNVVATCAISFKVNGTEVATANAPQTAEYSLAGVSHPTVPGFTWVGWSETEYADEVENAPAMITTYTPEAGETTKVLYGIYSRLDNSSASYGKYVKATVVAEGDYLIVCEGQNKVFDGSLSTLDASGNTKAATIVDGVLTLENADNYVFVIAAKQGGYSIKSASNMYIGTTSNANSLTTSATDTYTNTISISGGNVDIECSSARLRYNKTSGQERFRYFKSSSYSAQEAIQLYKKDNGATKYTSSPVEKVTITFNANGGEGGCQKAIINKGAEFTICENVPTKSHSEFAGWKLNETTTIYQANQNIGEVEEDITLTAQWNDAATYAVTYNVNGSSDAAPTQEAQYAGDQFEVGAAVTKEGFTFQGWKYGSKLYKAGASFTMPAEAVEFVAQWRKASVPVDKMSMVTSASALSNGMQIALGCSFVKDEQSYFAMAGDLGSNKYMASVTDGVSLSDGVATYTEDVVVMTLEQVEGGWKITKDGTNYLYAASNADMSWKPQADATVWTISFAGNNAIIASGNNKIQYNKQSPRFKTYTSQTDIQLFGKAVVVTEDASISDLGYTEGEAIVASGEGVTLTIDEPTTVPSITAQNGATVVIDEPTTTESVVVEEGSKIVANAETTAPTVYFATTMGVTDNNGDFQGVASELGKVTNITLATGGEIIYDLTLGVDMSTQAGVEKAANQWHAFSLPFAVDALNGIFDAVTGEKLENEVNYAIMDYHGDIRANGDYGWKKYRGILQPGVFYLMTVDGNTKTFRFKASVTGRMTQTNSMSAKAYDGAGEDSDKGWNGFGNPRWIGGTFAHNAQYLDPYTYEYVTITPGMTIPVGLPFFYKADETSPVSMGEVGASYGAPARNKAYEIKNVAIRFGNEESKDKLYISASEDALNEYEQDKDLVKMFMSQTPKVARISGNAYGMKLAMVNAPMVNDQATYGLTLYAPQAGEYTISAPAMDNADLYLTLNGAIIWNLSMGEYTSDFAKGNNEGYGLLLIKKIPMTPTGYENIEAVEAGVQKVVVDQNVFILRGEKMYDVTGKMVK